MRIAIASQNFWQRNNGQADFTRRLATGLCGRGARVLVMTPAGPGGPGECVQNGVLIHSLRSVSLARFYPDVNVTLNPAAEARALLQSFQPDIVHIQDHFPLCRAVTAIARFQSAPLVATNHFVPGNIIPFVPLLSRSSICRRRMDRYLWNTVVSVFSKAVAVAAPSRTAAALLAAHLAGIQVEPISCGVDVDRFLRPDKCEPAALRRAMWPNSDAFPMLVFVGRVDREKRIDVIIQALADPRCSEVFFQVAGSGRELPECMRLAHALGVHSRVRFLGFVGEEDLPALLWSADAFVMPSEAELLSIATLEAMSASLPILCADALALPELVKPGENGELFHSGDAQAAAAAIAAFIAKPGLWRQMGANSLERAQAHRMPSVLEAYEALYARALAKCPKPNWKG